MVNDYIIIVPKLIPNHVTPPYKSFLMAPYGLT